MKVKTSVDILYDKFWENPTRANFDNYLEAVELEFEWCVIDEYSVMVDMLAQLIDPALKKRISDMVEIQNCI